MIVTDYYPVMYTEDFEAEIQRFEEVFGFEVAHRPKIEFLDYAILENKHGRRIDLVRSYFPADSFQDGFLGMRANVDDYDEGVAYFETKGFTVFGTAHETESSITALMKKEDGTQMVLFHHKKK